MKEFILNASEKLINVFVIIGFIIVFLLAIGAASETRNAGEGIFAFIFVLIFGSIYVIFTAYFIYWMIDVRTTLKEIKKSLEERVE